MSPVRCGALQPANAFIILGGVVRTPVPVIAPVPLGFLPVPPIWAALAAALLPFVLPTAILSPIIFPVVSGTVIFAVAIIFALTVVSAAPVHNIRKHSDHSAVALQCLLPA
jgi:hypothetical protein